MDEKLNNPVLEESTYSVDDILREVRGDTADTAENSLPSTEGEISPAEHETRSDKAAEKPHSAETVEFPEGYDPGFAYRSMIKYAEELHVAAKRAIRSGYVFLLVLPAILTVLLKMTDGDKVFFLVVWIICMFVLAAVLIFIAFVDHEIQTLLDEVHANEKFGSLMSFERSQLLRELHERHRHHSIWHIHENGEGEVHQ